MTPEQKNFYAINPYLKPCQLCFSPIILNDAGQPVIDKCLWCEIKEKNIKDDRLKGSNDHF